MSRKMKVPLNLLTLSVNPLSGTEGDVYFNTTTKNIRIYNGAVWVDVTPASTDPTPFYMHTHTYDGDVHTIDVSNPITFTVINDKSLVEETLPGIIGLDGGNASSNITSPTLTNLTLLDGGTVGN
jgi:hypothetical protein